MSASRSRSRSRSAKPGTSRRLLPEVPSNASYITELEKHFFVAFEAEVKKEPRKMFKYGDKLISVDDYQREAVQLLLDAHRQVVHPTNQKQRAKEPGVRIAGPGRRYGKTVQSVAPNSTAVVVQVPNFSVKLAEDKVRGPTNTKKRYMEDAIEIIAAVKIPQTTDTYFRVLGRTTNTVTMDLSPAAHKLMNKLAEDAKNENEEKGSDSGATE